MTYIDCYLAPVLCENRTTYEDLAKISAQIVKEHGALRVIECWLDESGSDASSYHGNEARLEAEEYGSFVRAASAGTDDTVVMSFIEWSDKATRDAGMEKAMPFHFHEANELLISFTTILKRPLQLPGDFSIPIVVLNSYNRLV
ncbi:MAG: DUF1428 domain-containing protein [Leptolyngbyaceae cyanobacterium CSU_1_3]|nr:DUF1428 domain-containing protein [Leptolyngbyaceae cyanobacterium CSU_1_3]